MVVTDFTKEIQGEMPVYMLLYLQHPFQYKSQKLQLKNN